MNTELRNLHKILMKGIMFQSFDINDVRISSVNQKDVMKYLTFGLIII